jgi:hypothetical protein
MGTWVLYFEVLFGMIGPLGQRRILINTVSQP